MPKVFEFKVTLRDTDPPVWRQFRLHADATFGDLHAAIQDAFGWEFSHAWMFRQWSTGRRPGDPIAQPLNEWEPADTPDAEDISLSTFFPTARPKKCEYLYDFGDDWRHEVQLLGMPEVGEGFERRLVDGALACPPEDCGGTYRYAVLADFVRSGGASCDAETAEDLREWLGDMDWDPDRFDLTAAKRRFAR